MPSQLTAAPAAEPVLLADAKLHLRVEPSFTDDDALISALISAARQEAETITRRALITQTWLMALDQFPAPAMNVSAANWYGPQWGSAPGPLTTLRPDGKTGYEIWLPNPPLQAVASIKYLQDSDGTQQTLDPSLYVVDLISEPARIVPAYNTAWPGTRNTINAVQIAFTAGYGDSGSAVPEGIKAWIKLRVGTLYDNREEYAILPRGKLEQLPFVDTLLNPFRVLTF